MHAEDAEGDEPETLLELARLRVENEALRDEKKVLRGDVKRLRDLASLPKATK